MWDKIKRFFFADIERTNCRCCHAKLHRNGGILVPFVGAGFCVGCASKLTKDI